MKEKVAIVTGGAGFVGTNLCTKLLSQNWHVVCIDNLVTGRLDNLEDLLGNPKFTFLKASINNMFIGNMVREVLPKTPHMVERVYNLACIASPPKYQAMPFETLETSFTGTRNVIEMAMSFGAIMLHASTSEVYGDPLEHPQKESHWGNVNSFGPRACYDEGKRVAEALCYEYIRNHGMRIAIPRIFNTYGPHMDLNDGRVVTNFIRQGLNGEELTIYGDGKQTRSFQYIGDLLNAFEVLMTTKALQNIPVNCGNPVEYTMHELAHAVSRLLCIPVKVKRTSLPVDDPKKRKPDISLIRAHSNWSPNVQLDTGISATILYARKVLGKKDE